MKLSIKLFIILFLAIVLTGAFILYFSYRSSRHYQFAMLHERLVSEAALVRSAIELALEKDPQLKNMDKVADELARYLKLRVSIIAPDGRLVGDSDIDAAGLVRAENHLYRTEVQKALQAGFGESERFSATIHKDMLYLGYSFEAGQGRGVIRLAMPLTVMDAARADLRKILGYSLILLVVLSALIIWIASRLITRPIEEITTVTKIIARGGYQTKVRWPRNDEFGVLAQGINDLSDQIENRIEELNRDRQRMETVLLSMFDGILVVDAKGFIVLMNQTLRETLLVPQDPVGKKPIEVVRNTEIQEMTNDVLELDQGVKTREIDLVMPAERNLLIHASPIIREGKREGGVLVFHDITELRRLEKIRREFVANVSHELRTPLASIKGYAETLIDGALTDPEHAEDFLRIIHADAERLTKLIADLLDLARFESGKWQLETRATDLSLLLDRVLKSLAQQINEKKLAVIREIPPEFPGLKVDEQAMEQVFYNLIENAIKYNQVAGKVTISVFLEEQNCVIDVADTGVGIPDEDQPRIFERFYRVDKGRSREMGGTGLGLSIVKHIVQAHNGTVSVQSVWGRGSTFRITLPLS